ncbi:MAG: polymer-forming cytoskeletal protein [Acetivibrio ethanolgignens]
MGFLKDLKEDWSQAVNELLPEDELLNNLEKNKEEETEEPGEDEISLEDEFFQALDRLDSEEESVEPEEEEAVEEEEDEELREIERMLREEEEEKWVEAEPLAQETKIEEIKNEPEEDIKMGEKEMYEDSNVEKDLLEQLMEEEQEVPAEKELVKEEALTPPESGENTTIITKGTTINGSISSDGSLEVFGTITGDIECLGKLSIVGTVSGSSTAKEIYVNTSRLEGNLNSQGSVKVGVGTIVVGDISGTSAVIAGAVKGEVDVNGPVIVDSTAIVKGNINAKSVQINNGAVLDGYCSLSYSDVDLDNFFSGEN